jgi:hypothetical protein
MLKLTKWQVARGASVKSSWCSCMEGADKGRSHTHIGISSIVILGRKSREF